MKAIQISKNGGPEVLELKDISLEKPKSDEVRIEHKAIGAKLAEVAIGLEVARTIIWRAAWTSDNKTSISEGNLTGLPLSNIAHISSAEMLYKAAKDSAECFGAMGVMRDMPLQKFIHQTRMFLHRSSGNDDSKLQIAEAVAGFE